MRVQGKDLHVLLTPMSRQGAAKRSTGHIHPPHRPKNEGSALHSGRRRQKPTNSTDATSTIAFSSWFETLLAQRTAETISLVGEVDRRLS